MLQSRWNFGRRLTRQSRISTVLCLFPRRLILQRLWQAIIKSLLLCSGKVETSCSMLQLFLNTFSWQEKWRKTSVERSWVKWPTGLLLPVSVSHFQVNILNLIGNFDTFRADVDIIYWYQGCRLLIYFVKYTLKLIFWYFLLKVWFEDIIYLVLWHFQQNVCCFD